MDDAAERAGLEIFRAVHWDDHAPFVARAVVDGVAASLAIEAEADRSATRTTSRARMEGILGIVQAIATSSGLMRMSSTGNGWPWACRLSR